MAVSCLVRHPLAATFGKPAQAILLPFLVPAHLLPFPPSPPAIAANPAPPHPPGADAPGAAAPAVG